MSDEEILDLLAKDNTYKAYGHLYGYFPKVSRYIIKQNGSIEEAEDIFQDALIVFYHQVQNNLFTLNPSISAFLYAVCRRQWLKKCRDRKPEEGIDNLDFYEEDNPLLEDEEKFKQAQQAFAGVNATCRNLLSLFYIEKLSLKQISSKLNLGSEVAIKTRKYKCLEHAREIFKRSQVLIDEI